MANGKQLLLLCTRALSSFDSKLLGVDEHLQNFLSLKECSELNKFDQVFLSEVFTGCVQYRPLIKVVVDGYYSSDGRTSLGADANLYHVISYLAMFRLEELGMSQFKRLVSSQHSLKMYKYLRYLFDDTQLLGWIKDEWSRTYEQEYVERSILSPMLRFMDDMQLYIAQLKDKVENKTFNISQDKKPVTDVKQFNLTPAKPRTVPTPEKIPQMKPHKPVPKSTYQSPVESELLAKQRETQRLRAEELLKESEAASFSCAFTPHRSEKTKAIMNQIIEEREAQLKYKPFKHVPAPSTVLAPQPVKLNAAAILREGALVHKSRKEDEKRLADLVAGHKDDSEFQRWRDEMKQIDAAEQLARVEKRHLEGQLSYEEAIIAKQTFIQDVRDKVSTIKEEERTMLMEYFAKREEERKEMRRLVETVMAGHQNTQEAKTRLQFMKHKIVQQANKESRELMARALEEAEAEMRRKVELIQQIRAMESVPAIRTKFVDITETGGQGLLSEMSVAELRERLALMKVGQQEMQEKKRQEIAASKQAKEQLLNSTLHSINKHRQFQESLALASQEQQKHVFQEEKEVHDKKLSELQLKLEAKRREREKLKQSVIAAPPKTGKKKSGRFGANVSPTKKCFSQGEAGGSAIDTLLRTAVSS